MYNRKKTEVTPIVRQQLLDSITLNPMVINSSEKTHVLNSSFNFDFDIMSM